MSTWKEVPLDQVRTKYKGRHEIYEEIKYWVTEKEWRVRDQGHGFTLWPPDTGVRRTPPWVLIGGTPEGNPRLSPLGWWEFGDGAEVGGDVQAVSVPVLGWAIA